MTAERAREIFVSASSVWAAVYVLAAVVTGREIMWWLAGASMLGAVLIAVIDIMIRVRRIRRQERSR